MAEHCTFGGTFGGGPGTRALRRAMAVAFALCGMLGGALSGDLSAAPPVLGGDSAASRVPQPTVAISTPGKCVEDTQFMLRNHMEVLKHHRDRTVREGVRTTQHSLANCVACHASRETGRVTGSKDAFCESCHRFAAVSLDCFECHADKPAATAAVATSGRASP
jgi:hypothetical protein